MESVQKLTWQFNDENLNKKTISNYKKSLKYRMNLFVISWSYLKNKALNTFLNSLLLGLGIGIIVFLLLVQKQVEEKFTSNVRGIKMVVGAKGSPLQLILCNIYHIDNPTGNIPLKDAEQIANNKRFVKKSIPLALGDNYQGYRIVGSNRDFALHYQLKIARGTFWQNEMEVTIGDEVARNTGLKIGDSFQGAHGLDAEGHRHEEVLYKVKGILKKSLTVADRLILTQVSSVWKVHDKEDEVVPDSLRELTALLITQYTNPIAAINLPRIVNAKGNLQAASPALEINRLFNLLGIGEQVFRVFAYCLIAVSVLSIFIALWNALKERKYDLAIMRTLGASRRKLFIQIILEAMILVALGGLTGLLLGHFSAELIGKMEVVYSKVNITGYLFLPEELYILLLIFVVGWIASLIPAIQTYRIDISETLSR